MNKLVELAERVEKATGPDRELDGALATLVSGQTAQRVTVGPSHRREDFVFIDHEQGSAPIARPVPRYTASLDAAMTLVPEGWGHNINVRSKPEGVIKPNAQCWLHPHGTKHGDAATPALALCAAALRARAAQKD